MAGKLHRVFTRITRRSPVIQGHTLIERLLPVIDNAEQRAVALQLRQLFSAFSPEHPVRHLLGARAGNADDPQPSRRLRR